MHFERQYLQQSTQPFIITSRTACSKILTYNTKHSPAVSNCGVIACFFVIRSNCQHWSTAAALWHGFAYQLQFLSPCYNQFAIDYKIVRPVVHTDYGSATARVTVKAESP
jgi:hypothetical protein